MKYIKIILAVLCFIGSLIAAQPIEYISDKNDHLLESKCFEHIKEAQKYKPKKQEKCLKQL